MSKRPDIRLGQWITVSSIDCVVTNAYEIGSLLGDCEVMCIPEKPVIAMLYGKMIHGIVSKQAITVVTLKRTHAYATTFRN